MSTLAWVTVGIGIAIPYVVFVLVRARQQKIRDGGPVAMALSPSQRRAWEVTALGAWLAPTVVGFVMYILGYAAAEVVFGALATLAITLNLMLVGAVAGRVLRGVRRKAG